MLGEIWRRALSAQPVPGPGLVALLALVALAMVLLPGPWRVTRQVVTISHEGGHALGALLTGRRLVGIRLHSDTSGLTVSRGRPSGPGMVVMLAAGYLAPAVAGIGAALLLAAGHALGLLWLLLGWLVAMLLQIRNPYGFVVLVACGTAIGLATWYLPAVGQSALAYLVTWVLLLSAPKPLLELARQRGRGRAPHSDVAQLARITRAPGTVWLLGFLLANVIGLAIGVAVLLPSVAELVADLGSGPGRR